MQACRELDHQALFEEGDQAKCLGHHLTELIAIRVKKETELRERGFLQSRRECLTPESNPSATGEKFERANLFSLLSHHIPAST